MSGQQCIGVAEHYAAFVKLCRLRIEQLGITYDTVDEMCGFPPGYTATLLSDWRKTMSVYSLFTIAGGLALLPQFTHDEEKLARLKARPEWIASRRRGKQWRPKRVSGGRASPVKIRLHPDFMRKIARLGVAARMRNAEAKKRRINAARHAALARWRSGRRKA